MAVGDSVTGRLTGGATYQPSSGVEVMLTMLQTEGGNFIYYDGTNSSDAFTNDGAAATTSKPNLKMIVDNTNYLKEGSGSNEGWYCGIIIG